MDLWLIGAGGLLGSAVARVAAGRHRVHPAGAIPWSDPEASSAVLAEQHERFHASRRPGAPWGVVWAAGTGVVASTPEQLAAQERVLLDLATQVAARSDDAGAFLFASSASVYGAGGRSEYTEADVAVPVGPYATAKLRQEELLTALFSAPTGPRLAVARITTLYGPGQNLGKGQGLISSMCMEVIRRGVISLYVPIDTARDYVYTDDAAALCLTLLERAAGPGEQGPMMRIVGSHRASTVGELAHLVQAVAHRRTHVRQVQTALGALHVPRLAARTTDAELVAMPRTSLPAGIAAVHADVLRRLISGSLAA